MSGHDCKISKGTHTYRNVHVWGKGKLLFEDDGEEIHFWATAILVETDGSLIAGEPSKRFGDKGGKLTIHLYGAPQPSGGRGVGCHTGDTCGVPAKIWTSNVDDHGHPGDPAVARKVSDKAFDDVRAEYRGPVDDYFYAYHPLFHDDGRPERVLRLQGARRVTWRHAPAPRQEGLVRVGVRQSPGRPARAGSD